MRRLPGSKISLSIHYLRATLLALVVVVNTLGLSGDASAAYGFPESGRFAYGVNIDPLGDQVELGLNTAVGLGIDWINLRFDWNYLWPDPNLALDLGQFSKVISFSRDHGLNVMVSITNTPQWALTNRGPDPVITASLVAQLARLFPETLLAIELFPAANTAKGWGASPDPAAYVELLETCDRALSALSSPVKLVVAGLSNLQANASASASDMDDLDYLSQLYDHGAVQIMPIISIWMPFITGSPLAEPASGSINVLRHYEEVRRIMLENNHTYGLIWITGFSLGDNSSNAELETYTVCVHNYSYIESYKLVRWILEAYDLMQSQLYIGAAFINCVNPHLESFGSSEQTYNLIQNKNETPFIHPALATIGQMIMMDRTGQVPPVQTLLDKRNHPTDLKPYSKRQRP